MFRECFLGEEQKPDGDLVGEHLYISPVETWCLNLDYYIPDTNDRTKDFKGNEMTRIRKSTVILHNIPELKIYFIKSLLEY